MNIGLKPLKKGAVPIVGAAHWVDSAVLWTRGKVGQNLSVRWKLTLLYGLMCALMLTVVGLTLWVELERRTQATIDADLRAGASQIAVDSLKQHVGTRFSVPQDCLGTSVAVQRYCAQVRQTLDTFSTQIFAPGHVPGQFEQVQIWAPPFFPVIRPRFVKKGVLPLSDINPHAFFTTIQSARSSFETLHIQHTVTRWLITPMPVPPELRQQQIQAVLEVFQVERTFLDIERVTQIILLIVLPLGVLAALVAGWWIARVALRPIDRISRRVHNIGVSQDLTQRINFRGPEDEVSRLAYTFDGMMNRLEALFKAQKRFVADASHELRTPLTAIRGNADLMRIAPPEERELCIASIRKESERMSRLVNDMLLLAEVDLEEQPLHLQKVDLASLLEDLYRSTVVLADDRLSVRLTSAQPLEIQADSDKLRQVLLNLADNAVKFTPDGGIVTLTLRPSGGGACFEVSDTGLGIAPEEEEAIFQRLYRVETSRSTRGSGLGLAISSAIVRAHRGTIGVSSSPGRGSTFSVWLPYS